MHFCVQTEKQYISRNLKSVAVLVDSYINTDCFVISLIFFAVQIKYFGQVTFIYTPYSSINSNKVMFVCFVFFKIFAIPVC